MRFIELPSADERDHLVVNVDAITYIRVIHNTETGSDRSSTVTRFFFENGSSVDACVLGEHAELLRNMMGLKPRSTQ